MAQNGLENGSEGHSEAPESIPMVSDRSDFWAVLNPALNVIFFKNPSSGSSNSEILKFPKLARKRHNWIAELASFKMR